MAIKKGRATDAVARLFSVTATEQAHEAYEAHENKREHPVPETHEAQEAYEAPRMPDTQEAYEAQEPIFLKKDRLFLIGNFIKQRFSEISSAL